MRRGYGRGRLVTLFVVLGILGCAPLTRISEEGGLVGRALSRAEQDETPSRDGPATDELRPPGAQTARADGPAFAHVAHDHFFTLRWNTTTGGGTAGVRGVVENRNGPVFREVTLRMVAYGPTGLLRTERIVLRGPFDKKARRPFSMSVPVDQPGAQIRVEVAAYEFYQPRDR